MTTSDKITTWGVGLFGAWIAYRFFRGYVQERRIEGVGKLKRRIYKEVALAQQSGINFESKEYPEAQSSVLDQLGHNAGWKQSSISIASGKSYAEAYYNSLRRAWNAVSGITGVGTTYKEYTVKNAKGNPAIVWREYAPAEEHIKSEPKETLEELEERLAKKRRNTRAFDHSILPAAGYFNSGYSYGPGYGNQWGRKLTSYTDKYAALLRRGYSESEAARMANYIPHIYA